MEEEVDPLKQDFRKFLYVVWEHIGLPPPTPIQYDIAYFLQHGPTKICIEAFRGVGKSFITSAYVLWRLYCNPQLKFLVVSASKSRADAFTTFTIRLIQEIPILSFLKPKADQRNSRIEFDVGPALADQSPSVKSVGITGQLTGSRADEIIADDVEVLNNAATADMREKLVERIKEFSAILKPLPEARTIYLGTPQTEDSIYTKLPETFEVRIWPALVPTKEEGEKYGDNLATFVRRLMVSSPSGTTTDPQRFTDIDLAARQAEYGRSGFGLQFMLNTQLSDTERYPLKIKDLIIMDVARDRAPMKIDWLPDYKRELKDLVNLAMAGDRFYSPASHSDLFNEYTGTVMSIDPSGRGKDETGYAVVKMLNGTLYVRRAGGLPGGYDNATLQRLAVIAKEEGVNKVIIESNFGDGMYTSLFTPVISKIHPCSIEEVKHSSQKELRIIDTLEPVMNRHKLVIDKEVIEDDYKSAQAYDGDAKYTKALIYQLTRISKARGSLKHDDRLDALSMAVGYWVENMAQDADRGISRERADLLEKDLRHFMDHALGRRNQVHNNWNGLHGR
ncbi:hypothetical protein UFOVP63_42 [uncultured Caudovirales phage]|uniref:Terminase, large subunit n=1 Tax=uncultured Caudovirales phage TaxID=2100421 RepID=A0A6J5KVD5_9CAUD|nr:hypothetical protein UFOVP63_42 [uncultured Caudovirales phage]